LVFIVPGANPASDVASLDTSIVPWSARWSRWACDSAPKPAVRVT
jgi:hypothetical protein